MGAICQCGKKRGKTIGDLTTRDSASDDDFVSYETFVRQRLNGTWTSPALVTPLMSAHHEGGAPEILNQEINSGTNDLFLVTYQGRRPAPRERTNSWTSPSLLKSCHQEGHAVEVLEPYQNGEFLKCASPSHRGQNRGKSIV